MSLLANQIVFLSRGNCDVFSLEARGELWETLGTMCSSTTWIIGVGVGI